MLKSYFVIVCLSRPVHIVNNDNAVNSYSALLVCSMVDWKPVMGTS